MIQVVTLFIDFIFPCYCVSCGKPVSSSSNHLCRECSGKLKPLSGGCGICSSILHENACLFCNSRKFYPAKHISVFEYNDVVKSIMHSLKFGRLRGVYKNLIPFLLNSIESIENEIDLITFIPMNRKKQGLRGYNQSMLASRAISAALTVPCCRLLEEKGGSIAQREFGYAGRFINVIDRYQIVNKSKIEGKTVLIVDDIFTTGATVNECARQLLSAGAERVFSLTMARADLKKLENI